MNGNLAVRDFQTPLDPPGSSWHRTKRRWPPEGGRRAKRGQREHQAPPITLTAEHGFSLVVWGKARLDSGRRPGPHNGRGASKGP